MNGNDSLVPGTPKRDIGKRTVYRPELHEVIRLWSGGGGGYGDPFTRDPAAVARDVAAGLVSRERARDGLRRRAGRRRGGHGRDQSNCATASGQHGDFDFGEARSEWERVHGTAAERIAAWLPSLPVGVRRYAQAHAYQRLRANGPGPYGSTQITAALEAIGSELKGREIRPRGTRRNTPQR